MVSILLQLTTFHVTEVDGYIRHSTNNNIVEGKWNGIVNHYKCDKEISICFPKIL